MFQELNLVDPAVLVAVVGLVGSAVAFLWRGHLEKQSANKAVLAEIRRLLVVIMEHKHWYEKNDREDYPLVPFSYVVYKKQVDDIGVLHRRLVSNAVEFYGYVEFLNALQAARPQHKHYSEFVKTYVAALERCRSSFLHRFDDDFRRANIPRPDCLTLSRHNGPSANDPDVGGGSKA